MGPRSANRWRLSVRQGLGLVLIACLLMAGLARLFRAVHDAQAAARASQCLCNLCAIKLALHNYHEVHGCFPPAYLAGPDGKPAHSWRVLILPYLEERGLYALYDFDEPWDGPNNRALAGQMPAVYACPNHRPAGPGNTRTDYLAVTGPGTVFPGAGTTRLADIKDGPSNTIMVAEAAEQNVPWMAPIDLDIGTMSFRINDRARPSLSSRDPGGPAVVTADAGYHRLDPATSDRFLKAILTIDGDETVDWHDRR